jgi:hypothetical protein
MTMATDMTTRTPTNFNESTLCDGEVFNTSEFGMFDRVFMFVDVDNMNMSADFTFQAAEIGTRNEMSVIRNDGRTVMTFDGEIMYDFDDNEEYDAYGTIYFPNNETKTFYYYCDEDVMYLGAERCNESVMAAEFMGPYFDENRTMDYCMDDDNDTNMTTPTTSTTPAPTGADAAVGKYDYYGLSSLIASIMVLLMMMMAG